MAPDRGRFPVDGDDPLAVREKLEHLRRGTFNKFESDWFQLQHPASTDPGPNSQVIDHDLGSVPQDVDTLASTTGPGENPVDGNPDVFIVKDARTIAVYSQADRPLWFKVRAF